MRYLLIEDHPLVRDALKRLLLHGNPAGHVEEVSSACEAMKLISSSSWDVVFLDIDLPDRSGLDLLSDFRSIAPQTPVLVLSGMLEEEFGERALEAGAAGFLHKLSMMDEILTAVRRVCAGKKYISPDLAARLMEKRLNACPKAGHDALSTREFEVLRLLGKGRTVSEVAALLNISAKTVSTYRTRVLEKLGLTTTAEIIRYTLQHRLDN